MKLIKNSKDVKMGNFYLEYNRKLLIIGKATARKTMTVVSIINGESITGVLLKNWNLFFTSDMLFELNEHELIEHILLETI